MNSKRIPPLLLGLFLMVYGITFADNFVHKKSIRLSENFTDIFHQLFLIIAFLLFLGLIWWGVSKSSSATSLPARTARFWWAGFSSAMLIALGLIVYVNPHARFGIDVFPPITPSARSVKIGLYRETVTAPEIVVLGSSRAFTLSPQYINERTGYSAFNMAVEGGRVGDFSVQLNYMLRSGSNPHILLIEAAKESLDGDFLNLDLQPLALIPYMPISVAISVAENSLRDTFSVQSLSDSVYILTLPDVQTRLRTWTFEDDGLGIRKPLTHDQYVELLAATIERRLDSTVCTSIDPSAKEIFERMIGVAEANHVAVVLYESPMHATFYKLAYKKNPDKFDACRRLLNNYFSSLSNAYPNVFFRDLSDYSVVNDLEEEGFYDAVHLRPEAAELVVDALIPEIESAMQWSLQESAK